MRYALAPLALAAFAAAAPQGVTSAISPMSTAPAGCQSSYPGTFKIQIVNVTTSTGNQKRQTDNDADLVISLNNGMLKDEQGRTGYIAANRQFQFDGPPQTGAIYTSGFSVCGNGSLALGGSAIFYGCLSGTFYNLYDQSQGAQCSPIYIDVLGSSASATGAATQSADGQPAASTAGAATQISDGQIQATTATPVSQISDGQIQATSATGKPVSQISDGQVQATTKASTAGAVTQISDGQIQATTATPVNQISDGQIQATGGATMSRNGTMATATPSVVPYTGGAAVSGVATSLFVIVAGVFAGAML